MHRQKRLAVKKLLEQVLGQGEDDGIRERGFETEQSAPREQSMYPSEGHQCRPLSRTDDGGARDMQLRISQHRYGEDGGPTGSRGCGAGRTRAIEHQ